MSISFSKDSWHYKFIRKMTRWYPGEEKDNICAYTRAFVVAVVKSIGLGAIIAALTTVVVAIIIFPAIAALVYGFCHLFHLAVPAWVLTKGLLTNGIVVWCAFGTIVAVIASIFGFFLLRKYIRNNRKDAPPSAIAQMVNHWHDKTCAKIDWK